MDYTIKDFRSDAPPPRIMGAEMEYHFQCTNGSLADVVNKGLGYLEEMGISRFGAFAINGGMYLSNGGKVYPDVSNLEYATPECLNSRQLMLAEEAGRIIMTNLVSYSKIKHEGLYGRAVSIDYINPGTPNKTSGYHENYGIPNDDGMLFRIQQFMPTFLATRVIWGGSGYIDRRGYGVSQKSSGIGQEFVVGTMDTRRCTDGQKPMILINHDEQDDGMTRCEIRSMDPTPSWYAKQLGFSATSLFLRLLESRHFNDMPDLPRLKKPVKDLQIINRDVTLSRSYNLTDGTKATAAEIQFRTATIVRDCMRKIALSPEDQQAAEEWVSFSRELCDFQNKGPEAFGDRIAWIARKAEMERRLGPDGPHVLTPKSAMLDLLWDRKDRYDLGRKAFSHDWSDAEAKEAEILVSSPPETTRAAVRGQIINAALELNLAHIDWGTVSIKNRPCWKIKPHDAYKRDLTKLAE